MTMSVYHDPEPTPPDPIVLTGPGGDYLDAEYEPARFRINWRYVALIAFLAFAAWAVWRVVG